MGEAGGLERVFLCKNVDAHPKTEGLANSCIFALTR
jgi:hypothetical protein